MARKIIPGSLKDDLTESSFWIMISPFPFIRRGYFIVIKIHRFGWIWHARSAAVLSNWTDHIETLRRMPVKSNPIRVVFQAEDLQGRKYFVKLEKKSGFLARLRTIFHSKARSEFRSACLLKQCGIPAASYVAWGRNGSETGVVSEALNGYISARKYWYETAIHDSRKAEDYLNKLLALTAQFRKYYLIHPDFHDGNLMVHPSTGALAVIDPYGIYRIPSLYYPKHALRMLLSNAAGLRGLFSMEYLAEKIAADGIVSAVQTARILLLEIEANHRLKIEKEWARRTAQILSGKSKFCRSDGSEMIRNTAWYDKTEWNPDLCEIQSMKSVEAERIWVESFRKELLYEPVRLPVVWKKGEAGEDTLFFLKEEN